MKEPFKCINMSLNVLISSLEAHRNFGVIESTICSEKLVCEKDKLDPST